MPTRFSSQELATLDRLVAAGLGATRSDVVRRAVSLLDDAVRRAEAERQIVASYRLVPPSAEDDRWALANAIAMVEDEPW